MKEKKEITEHDLELLQKHINTTKLRLIDMQNQFNKSLGKIRGTMFVLSLILVIIIIIGYIL